MNNIWSKTAMGIAALSCALWLGACGNGKEEKTNASASPSPSSAASASAAASSPSPQSSAAEERVFVDDFGNEVKLTGTPERVLAVYLEDPLVALGVKPLLQFNFGGTGASYLQSQIGDVPLAGTATEMMSPEQALDAAPDLIIAHSLVTAQTARDEFAKIAPTYVLDASKSDWKAILRKIGELLNLSDKAEQLLKDYDARIASAKEQLGQATEGETFALLRLTGKEYRLYGTGDQDPFNGKLLYEDLGLTPAKLVRELPQEGGGSLSLETLPELDADHLILVINDAGKAQAQELMNSSIWKGLPAVKKNQVYEVDPTLWLSIGYMANTAKIEDLLSRVAQ